MLRSGARILVLEDCDGRYRENRVVFNALTENISSREADDTVQDLCYVLDFLRVFCLKEGKNGDGFQSHLG